MIDVKLAKILVYTFLVSVFSNTAISAKTNQEQPQPNVLWILTDDQRYDAIRAFNRMLHGREMSELGYVESPNIDRLAEMGTTFINTYCHAQGCAPSRASMHYGRYPFRSGIYEFEYHNNNTTNSYPHLPEQMAKLGYQTVHVGKLGVRLRTIINGKVVKPEIYQTDIDAKKIDSEGLPEWGKVSSLTQIDGQVLVNPLKNIRYLKTDEGRIYYISEQLETENPQFAGMAQEAYDTFDLLRKHTNTTPETVFNSGILAGVSPKMSGKTRDGYYTSSFIDFLSNENKSFQLGNLSFKGVDPSKPLFCHIGYDFPHTPVLPPAEYRERFHTHSYEVPALSHEEWASMPAQLKKQVKNSFSNEFTHEQKQKMVRDYYAFCAYGDDLVGQAVDAFIDYSENKDQPWLIVYVCGDHGWKLNEHGAYSKFTPWEIDSHNPIIVVSSHKDAFPAGKVVEDYTEFVDIAPTVLSAAGAEIDRAEFDYLDGMDLADVASGEAPERDYVIGESHAVTGPRAYIRTSDFVFSMQTRPNKNRGENLEWALNARYEELDPALYHMPSDPHEINNLAFDKEYEEIARIMKEKLINIVLGDNRAETNWGTGTNAIGTEVHRSNFAPGAHDYKLHLPYNYLPGSTQELRIRSGLPNFFAKANRQDTIVVGYIGGSITAGEGEWSERTFNWLKEQYPQSHFDMVNVAVPGTGVDFGSFRIGTEMLVHDPDLVFIEYRVNGLGGQGIRGIEGMIRQVYRSNPKTDICIVYTIAEGMIELIRNGQQTSVGEVMETAVNHYGIPSIDMGIEVVRLLDQGELIFTSTEPVEGKIVFSEDGTHPLEAGAEIYKDVVARSLLEMEDYSSSVIHALPGPIDYENFGYPTIHIIDEVSKNSNWNVVDTETDEIYRSARWRSAYVVNKAVKCNIAGESLSFEWNGFGLCMTTIPQGEGMTIEVSTDGAAPKVYVFTQNGTDRYGSVMFYHPYLEAGRHTTEVKITELPDASTFYFGQFYSVDLPPVDSLVVTPELVDLTINEKYQLNSAVFPPEAAWVKPGWMSSDGVFATVSESGEVTALKAGEVKIIAVAGDKSDTCQVKISPVLASSLTVSPDLIALIAGDSLVLQATVLPETTSDASISWKSGNSDIATVKEQGLVKAISAGNTFIEAINEASGLSDTAWVTVTGTSTIASFRAESVKLYPNPVSNGELYVVGTDRSAMFAIRNILGETVIRGIMENSVIDVGSLPNGLYFLQIDNNYSKFIKA